MKKLFSAFSIVSMVLMGAGCSKTVEQKTTPTSTMAQSALAVRDTQLNMGTWKVISGGTGFETIELYAGGQYSSFLHDRPFDDGRWLLDNGELQLDSLAGDEQSYLFTSVMMDGERLVLYQGAAKNVWEQVK